MNAVGDSTGFALERRHAGIVILILLGAVLRFAFMVGYRPAFWFYGDSFAYLLLAERALEPHSMRPLGYVVLLKVLAPWGTLYAVSVLQHVLGLALALAVYAYLRRRGAAAWICGLAAAPVLFDATQVTLEHYVLSETLLTALLVGGVFALVGPRRPDVVDAGTSGLLLAAAWFTKPTALPVVAVLLLYLVLRRVGWRPVLAYAAAFAGPYLAAHVWFGDRPNAYSQPVMYYARTAFVADCDRLVLPAPQRAICPAELRAQRPDRADAFVWGPVPEAVKKARNTGEGAEALTGFALSVLRQQPGDLALAVGRETLAHFVPGMSLGPGHDCLRERWSPPPTVRDAPNVHDHCHPELASPNYQAGPLDPRGAPPATPLTRLLHAYGQVVRSVPVVLSAAVLLSLAAIAARRRVDPEARRDGLVLLAAGIGMVLASVVGLMYDQRYAMPALPLVSVAAGLALHQLVPRATAGESLKSN